MTAHATDARIDVGAVVEVDIIRELVNPDPLDRLPRGIAFADFLSSGLSVFTFAWQFMQTWVGGMAA